MITQKYHKIQTIYKRDPETKYKTLLEGEFSLPEFEYLANNEWEYTEKVDGTNIRVDITENGITIGGRTDNAETPPFLLDAINELLDNDNSNHLAHSIGGDVSLYGEGYGPKIQKRWR